MDSKIQFRDLGRSEDSPTRIGRDHRSPNLIVVRRLSLMRARWRGNLSDRIAWSRPRSWKSSSKAVMARFSGVDSRASQSSRKREAWSVTVSGKQYRPFRSSLRRPAAEPPTANARPSPNTPSTASPLPWRGERCYPCVRYDLSPMSRAAHSELLSRDNDKLKHPGFKKGTSRRTEFERGVDQARECSMRKRSSWLVKDRSASGVRMSRGGVKSFLTTPRISSGGRGMPRRSL